MGSERVWERTEATSLFEDDDRRALEMLRTQIDNVLDRLNRSGHEGDACTCHKASVVNEGRGASIFQFPGKQSSEPGVQPAPYRASKTPLPDPRLLRRVINQRQLRAQVFPAELFSDPAWDMLLDLTAAHAEHKRVSVTSLCIASGYLPRPPCGGSGS